MFVDKLFAAEAYVKRFAHEDKGLEASKHLYDLTVMSKLPRIVNLLNDENSLENMIFIQMKEEMNRLGGVPGLMPKYFEVFDRIRDDLKLHDAFRRMENVYVLYDKDRFSVSTMLSSMDDLRKALYLNRSWVKDTYRDFLNVSREESSKSVVDHSEIGNSKGKSLENPHGPKL